MGCLYQCVTVAALPGMVVITSDSDALGADGGGVTGGVACVEGGGVVGGVVVSGGVCAPTAVVSATTMAGMIKVLMMIFPFFMDEDFIRGLNTKREPWVPRYAPNLHNDWESSRS